MCLRRVPAWFIPVPVVPDMPAMKDDITVVSQSHHAALSPEYEQKDNGIYDASVPTRYRGTAYDKKDMTMLGKRQVLRVGPSKDCLIRPRLTNTTAQL